ncbi:hypothetical protein CPB83DRAFT_852808 [Crepidotus variabilis]|uniref:Uncharacterized protein n=1 Tax=Crepidotus variabilis TaxID=179855 RepID=A0A9P6EHY3_9AGAR|nr:hypothetical protein CPB83DRAFT_852808 [Crepidotus variabilis]
MPFAVAPALLFGLGARIFLDKIKSSDGSFLKDFILIGVWQGVALHYAARASGISGLGIFVAFAISVKVFIEFNLAPDVIRVVTTFIGVALGLVGTEGLSQQFDSPHIASPERKRRKTVAPKPPPRQQERRHQKIIPFHSSTEGASVVTSGFSEHTLATNSFHLSDITSVNSTSERPSGSSLLTPTEREVHILRTRAALADSERRRLKEERKWAISAGNMARASQLKWEVKRFTALMETFNREADSRSAETSSPSSSSKHSRASPRVSAQKPITSAMKDRSRKDATPHGQTTQPLRRVSYSKQPGYRGANG